MDTHHWTTERPEPDHDRVADVVWNGQRFFTRCRGRTLVANLVVSFAESFKLEGQQSFVCRIYDHSGAVAQEAVIETTLAQKLYARCDKSNTHAFDASKRRKRMSVWAMRDAILQPPPRVIKPAVVRRLNAGFHPGDEVSLQYQGRQVRGKVIDAKPGRANVAGIGWVQNECLEFSE